MAHRDHPGVVRAWLRELADDDVTVLSLHGNPPTPPPESPGAEWVAIDDLAGLRARLAMLGTLEVVVVTAPPGKLAPVAADLSALVPHLYFHLGPGGALVVDRTLHRGKVTPLVPPGLPFLEVPAAEEAARRGRAARGEPAVPKATRATFVSRRHVVAVKRHRHLYKLGEAAVDPVLAAREPDLHVATLVTLPAGAVESAEAEHLYGPGLAPLPLRLDHPPMAVRHYEGELRSRGATYLHSGSTLLPESFRWPWEEELAHPRVTGVSDDFVERATRPGRRLDGDYYFVDCVFSGHFGHLMTEMVARLWGWEHARRELPDLKALFHVRNSPGKDGGLERRLFAAYGIPESALVSSDRPVRLRSVVGASPLWQNRAPFIAHPEIKDTWARLTSGLLAGRAAEPHDRVFVSRGRDVRHRRSCRNQDEVEKFFADRGFLVLYPEEHPLEEQVAIFAGARVVAGFAGSAMFNLMHCQRLEAVVVLSHSAYVHRNEHLFARMHGAQLHHFYSPHDPLPPTAGPRAYARAPWGFDFPGLGRELDSVLAEL